VLSLLVHAGHRIARSFFTPANANSYNDVARLATFGQDQAWKREIINAVGKHYFVLDLACGTGVLSSMLSEAGKKVVGIDLANEYLRMMKHKFDLPLALGTAEILPYRGESFDAAVSSYLAKYVNIQDVVDECWRVLKPGGVLIFHDFTYPKNRLTRRLWSSYFSILRLIGRFALSWRTVFEQLDDVIMRSDWTGQSLAALHRKGFHKVSCRSYTAYTAAIVSAEKP
jgi:demethylmenaquinone methyltransferase/2-methoxy-6-polyprenyl-1,4-benzoquinol methylase